MLFLERGTSAGARRGWETRRRGRPLPQTPRDYRRAGRRLLGFAYSKIPRGRRAVAATKLFTPTGKTKSEKQIEKMLRKLGAVKNPRMGLGVGLSTKSGVVKHTLMSNDRKTIYTGPTLGMRQKIMSWHKNIGETLPHGFENWNGKQIEALFKQWDKKSTYLRKLRRYTKAVGG